MNANPESAGKRQPMRKVKPSFSPAIYEYLRKYQEDPTSRVFAPLAEAYRKAGLPDEAIEIAKEGLRVHPSFIGGKVALARALFDKRSYQEVIDLLAAVVEDAPDNLVAERLLAESYLIQGALPEALNCYKMLLYFSPGDAETAQLVHELETQAYEQGRLVLNHQNREPPRTDSNKEPSEIAETQSNAQEFTVRPIGQVLHHDPELKRKAWVNRIERLQRMLQKVERYRILHG